MRRDSLFWGLILVILGGLFFMQTAGMIRNVFDWFWPLALILLGLFVLFGRYLPRAGGTGESFSVDLQGAARLNLKIDHGAGSVSVGPGAPAGKALAGTQGSGLDIHTSLEGDELDVKLDAGPTFIPFLGPEGGEWRFQLTGEIPVRLQVDAGATNLNVDMTGVKLTYLGVDTGASSVNVKLPADAGQSKFEVHSGAATINLVVPDGVGARISLAQGVSTIKIDETRFPAAGPARTLFQSADYESAPNRVEVNLEGGANTVVVR